MRIAEIFRSVQGEGFLTGTDSVFVRTSGCNLRCWFCDTAYTSWHPEGEDLSFDHILREVSKWDSSHVVVTGGEPMLFAELIPLCAGLRAAGRHITIETAGTLHLPLDCDLMSISPKLSNSTPSHELSPEWHVRHEQSRHVPKVIRQLIQDYPYQMKFVVESRADCQEVESYLARFPEIDRQRVLLMPQGTDPAHLNALGEWLEPYCQTQGLHYCPRKHIQWFGAVRGT